MAAVVVDDVPDEPVLDEPARSLRAGGRRGDDAGVVAVADDGDRRAGGGDAVALARADVDATVARASAS
ncbi:MAG: hypothetical protein HS111_08800 [Kofleriaceae bacterium]|nr:hypothetical protein [Kofleriaceae bacterium]